jgi:hypothetical protein
MLGMMSKRFNRSGSGAAGVEFALVLPLLVILAFGAVEMGRMLWHHEIITKSVRNGVRYLTRVPVTCTAVGSGGTFSSADTDAAINLVKTGTTASGTPILEAYDSATFDIEVDCVDAAAAGLSGGTYMPIVRMTAEVPYSDFFIGMIGLDDATFTVTHEELNVGE